MSSTIAPTIATPQIVVGIDPSLTGTAVCVIAGASSDSKMSRVGSSPDGRLRNPVESRIRRVFGLTDDVVTRVPFGATVFIEGYSYASNDANASLLREYGGLLRWALIENGNEIVEVSPSSLKKFVCGSGGSAKNPVKKEHMMAHAHKRWGVMFSTSDECDAFGLCKIGMCYCGREAPADSAQREVIEKLRGGPAPKKPSKRKVAEA